MSAPVPLSRKVDAGLSHDHLPGFTVKLDIGNDSVYVKTAWLGGEIVYLDVTLGHGEKTEYDELPKTERQADLEHQNYALARSWVEDSCRMASKLLQRGADIHEVTGMWMGINGFPFGPCPQLQSIVPGPLHATAMLINRDMDGWASRLSGRVC